MLGEHVDLVAGDFDGTAWRCSNRNNISTMEEALWTALCQRRRAPTPLWGPGSIPNNWADVCGFLKLPDSDRYWKVRLHGAFVHLHMKLWACARPIKAATMRHGVTTTSSIGAAHNHIMTDRIDEFS